MKRTKKTAGDYSLKHKNKLKNISNKNLLVGVNENVKRADAIEER